MNIMNITDMGQQDALPLSRWRPAADERWQSLLNLGIISLTNRYVALYIDRALGVSRIHIAKLYLANMASGRLIWSSICKPMERMPADLVWEPGLTLNHIAPQLGF